jgi:multidrug efflux pump
LKPAVRIQADLTRLAAYGISLEDVRAAISGANVSGPKGSLDGAQQSYMIAANDQLTAAAAYDIVIAYRDGAPIALRRRRQSHRRARNAKVGGWYQGEPAVVIDIQRQPAPTSSTPYSGSSASCRAVCRTPCRRRSSSPS